MEAMFLASLSSCFVPNLTSVANTEVKPAGKSRQKSELISGVEMEVKGSLEKSALKPGDKFTYLDVQPSQSPIFHLLLRVGPQIPVRSGIMHYGEG